VSGWNGSQSAGANADPPESKKKAPSSLRGVLAGVVVVCAAAVVAFVFLRGGNAEKDADGKKPRLIKEAKPAAAPKAKTDAEPAKKTAKPVTNAVQTAGEKVKTPEEIEAEERAKDPLYDRHHIVAKKPLVESPTEQLMLSVFSTELGDMPPMIPTIPEVDEEQVRKTICLLTLEKEGDSDEAKDAKALVNDVKAELKKFLDDGGTVNGFLAYYVNQLDSAFQERNTCRELLGKSMRQDSPEVARELFNKYNERLEKKGIKPLKLTSRQKQHLGIED